MGEEEVLQEGMAEEAIQLRVAADMAGMGRVVLTGAFHLPSVSPLRCLGAAPEVSGRLRCAALHGRCIIAC